MGSDRSVGKFNSKYGKVRIFQAIIKSTGCWPGVKSTGMIPDVHMLCCIIIFFNCRSANKNLVHAYVENGHVCPSGLLSWTVAFRSIVGMLLMITLSCFSLPKNYMSPNHCIPSHWPWPSFLLVSMSNCAFVQVRDNMTRKWKKINSSGLCA